MTLILRISLTLSLILLFLQANSQKSTIGHSVYEKWENITNVIISSDGEKVAWVQSPGKGDNKLIIYQVKKNSYDTILYASSPVFSPDASFLIFRINLSSDSTRKMQLAKKKAEKYYTVGIFNFANDSITCYNRVIKHSVPGDEGSIAALLIEKENKKKAEKSDTVNTNIEKVEEDTDGTQGSLQAARKKTDKKSNKLLILTPSEGYSFEIDYATEYSFASGGKWAGIITTTEENTDSISILIYDVSRKKTTTIHSFSGNASKLCLDSDGSRLAWIFSCDTTKAKTYELALHNRKKKRQLCFSMSAIDEGKHVSEHAAVYFSSDGNSLFFGISPKPEEEIEDSLPASEKARLDLWSYTDDRLQPMQLLQLDNDNKMSRRGRLDIASKKIIQLEDDSINSVQIAEHGDAAYYRGIANTKYRRTNNRLGRSYYDLYRVSRNGDKLKLAEQLESTSYVLPDGKNAVWYDLNDSSWYHLNIQTGEQKNLTKNLAVEFYDVMNDRPSPARHQGFAGWSENYRYVYINSRYDIWQFDLSGKISPISITANYGEEKQIRLRRERTNNKETFVDFSEANILYAYSETDKRSGYYLLSSERNLLELFMQDEHIYGLVKASQSETIVFRRSSFIMYPDVWLTEINFSSPERISFAGNQIDEYHWGSVETVKWVCSLGNELEGLLYKPANLDESKKYPLIVYFYERSSQNLHRFYHPSPSRSVISFPFYTSNGYAVFVPDIIYRTGSPGDDAYEAVMSGLDALKKYTWIDTTLIGLQGQSWGGYQVAYIITQTERFRAAMAGAPVANMTSAYGGIRWGSGRYRASQYELGQSRIGASLWESPELYINNSPLFFADKINTPLLMMANDNDGAVPWYQGIELFTALYRLDKEVWMLNYNNDGHNLIRWPNRVDLSIRMFDFFGHYLQDQPKPAWMQEGIPAVNKGK